MADRALDVARPSPFLIREMLCSPMTRLANKTSRRDDEARSRNMFNRAAAFHTMSAQLALLFFHAPALAFLFLAQRVKRIKRGFCKIDHMVAFRH
jgi:hypothetical protein